MTREPLPRRKHRLLGLFLAMALTAAAASKETAPPAASPQPRENLDLPVPASVFKETKRRWLGYYLTGAKSGWGAEKRGPVTVEGRPLIAVIRDMTLEMAGPGGVRHVEARERRYYSVEAPYRAFLIEDVQKSDGQARRVIMRHTGGTSYTAEITEAGKTHVEEMKGLEIRLSQETTPTVWASDPRRQPGDVLTSIDFSCEQMKMRRRGAVIVRGADWAGPGGIIPVWEMASYPRNPKDDTLVRAARADGRVVNARVAGTVELREEPEQMAKTKPATAPDLFRTIIIQADRKLGKSPDLKELVLELTAPEGSSVPELPETAHQTAARKPDGTVTLRITNVPARPRPVSAAERAATLAATPRYPLADETVKKLAAQAVAGASDDRTRVGKLLSFTEKFLRKTPDNGPLTVMDLLQSRRGDCTAHALLFTTLARAAGIPAREAGGWIYMGDESRSFGGHAWSEVALDGQWVPVDPIWSEPRLDAGHIQLDSGGSNGRGIVPLVSGLKAKVLSFKTK